LCSLCSGNTERGWHPRETPRSDEGDRKASVVFVFAMSGVSLLLLLAGGKCPVLPVDAAELVCSFLPRSLAFDSMPFPFGRPVRHEYGFYAGVPQEVVSYDEMRQRIHRYIVDGETVGGPDVCSLHGMSGENFEVIIEYGIKLVMFLGLDDRVTLLSIFLPPISSQPGVCRAYYLCLCMGLSLGRVWDEWRTAHGTTPEAIEWSAEVHAWYDIWMGER
jgi:hypothetical protein